MSKLDHNQMYMYCAVRIYAESALQYSASICSKVQVSAGLVTHHSSHEWDTYTWTPFETTLHNKTLGKIDFYPES